MKRRSLELFVGVILGVLTTSCANRTQGKEDLSCVQLVDRNGIYETIDQKERLKQIGKVDFLHEQPYEKVVRVYKRDELGQILAKISSYHENGCVFQYLETLNNRAHGAYKEWYPNGKLRIETRVMEGVGDLTPEAMSTWVFDGISQAFDEEGRKLAEISYEKGKLEGESNYFYPSGKLSKSMMYKEDQIDGDVKLYNEEGKLIGSTHYEKGKKEGRSFHEKGGMIPQREEEYKGGLLEKGSYWNLQDEIQHKIVDGCGVKPIYEEAILHVEHEYKDGKPEGSVKIYRKNGTLENMYRIVEGAKEGLEVCYYDTKDGKLNPSLEMNWVNDELTGIVRTWYPNNVMESEREMVNSKKQGFFVAWYENGDLMMVEEYDNDELKSGKYMKKGDQIPVSKVVGGNGTMTLYDSKGNFLRKIEYQKGVPSE